MDISINVVIDGEYYDDPEKAFGKLTRKLEKQIDDSVKPLGAELRRALMRVEADMRSKHGKGWNGGVVNNSPNLQRRSGNSLASIAQTIKVSGGKIDSLMGQIGTGDVYTIHETGGTITAKGAAYLTIPLPAALDGRGVPLRQRARDWDNTFVARSRRGNLLIFRREQSRITPLYILKRSVTIRPRLGMEKSFLNNALPYFEARAFEVISEALSG